ncbi:hypothetical protein NC652_007945 [Populus alba x Populus x berolinensis]|nr:hypothetical protein NC652_007945 [Populus alba x Populus x berolinensis]
MLTPDRNQTRGLQETEQRRKKRTSIRTFMHVWKTLFPSHFFFTLTIISHFQFELCSSVNLLIESHSISTFEANFVSNMIPTCFLLWLSSELALVPVNGGSRLERGGSTNPFSRSTRVSCFVKISMASEN